MWSTHTGFAVGHCTRRTCSLQPQTCSPQTQTYTATQSPHMACHSWLKRSAAHCTWRLTGPPPPKWGAPHSSLHAAHLHAAADVPLSGAHVSDDHHQVSRLHYTPLTHQRKRAAHILLRPAAAAAAMVEGHQHSRPQQQQQQRARGTAQSVATTTAAAEAAFQACMTPEDSRN